MKCPTTTTGMLAWKSWGGLPVLATCTTLAPSETSKSAPADVEWMVPGTTSPSRRKVWVPSDARWAKAWSTVSK